MLLPRPTDACANAKCKMRDVRVQSVGDDILGVPRECDACANAKCRMQNARCKGAIRRGRHPWRPARMRCLRKCKMQNAECKMQNARCKGAIRRGRHPCESRENAMLAQMQNAECRMQNARCKGAIRRGRHPCESCEVMYTDSRVKKCLTLIMPMIIYEKRERKAKGAFVPVSYSRRESKKITF